MVDREVTAWTRRGLFEPALPLGVDEPPAVLDELAPRVSLGAGDGELSLKLGVNRLVVADNGVGVLVWLASGVGERMDRGGHPVGHHPVRGRDPNGWRPVRVSWWSPCGRQGCQRMVDEPLTDSTRRCQPSICPGRDALAYCVLRLPTLISPPARNAGAKNSPPNGKGRLGSEV